MENTCPGETRIGEHAGEQMRIASRGKRREAEFRRIDRRSDAPTRVEQSIRPFEPPPGQRDDAQAMKVSHIELPAREMGGCVPSVSVPRALPDDGH